MKAWWVAAATALVVGCAEEATIVERTPDLTESAPALDPETLPEALKSGEISPLEAVGTYVRRIERIDQSGPTLQSVIALSADAVPEAQRLSEVEEKGRLHGLPILIKDNIETRELPTTAGSLALENNNTGRDAPAVARLREEGAIILGKTNLSEWANFRGHHSISGWSAMGGLTRNPHALDRNTCGSSSGSGAAVAAGLAWAALGTETNGSVTCPAAMNGIVGFKPTVGLISRRHVVPISSSQDTIGPMTTSVRDAAMLLTVMAGTDSEDAHTAEADARKTDYLAALEGASLEGVKIGILRWAASGDDRENAVLNEALRRAEAAGAILVDIDAWGGEPVGGDGYLILQAEFKALLNDYLADAAPGVEVRSLEQLVAFNKASPREMALFDQGVLLDSLEAPALDDDTYLAAKERVSRLRGPEGIDRLLAEHHVEVLVAQSFGPAFMIDAVRGDIIANNAGAGWLPAQAGYPHLTLPMGSVKDLPLGLSIIGTKWADAKVLRVGHAWEAVLPPRLQPTFRSSAQGRPEIAEALEVRR